MTTKQRRFLERRFREASQLQPELKLLKRLLLRIGGTYLVAPRCPDIALPRLISDGFVMAGPLVRRTMRASECHRNVAQIWLGEGEDFVGIGTGYALSDDGLWREHSWGVLREGVLETTVPRLKYFGVVLQDAEADFFALANSDH